MNSSSATVLSYLLFVGLLPPHFPLKIINVIFMICWTSCSWINKVKKIEKHITLFSISSCYRAALSLGDFCKVLYVDLLTLST